MNVKMLSPSWETEGFTICDVELSEAESIREIFNACSYVEPWDETFAPTDIERSTTRHSVAPNRHPWITTESTMLLSGRRPWCGTGTEGSGCSSPAQTEA